MWKIIENQIMSACAQEFQPLTIKENTFKEADKILAQLTMVKATLNSQTI